MTTLQESRPLNPLFRMAVIAGVASAIKIHIQRGDDLNARDTDGLTPLMLAAKRNKPGICSLLISSGADPSLIDLGGKDALFYARQAGADATYSEIQAAIAALVPDELQNTMLDMLPATKSDPPKDSVLRTHVVEQNHHQEALNFHESVSLDDSENFKQILDAKSSTSQEITNSFDLDIEHATIDISDWEPEVDPMHSTDDPIIASEAANVQISITNHTPLDSSSDWDDLDVYLPITSAPLSRTNDVEGKASLRLLLLRAIREGSVPDSAVVDLANNDDRTRNEAAEALLRMVINDLGAETDDRFETVNDNALIEAITYEEESPDEDELISEAMALIDRHESNQNDPFLIYQRGFQREKLITAAEEVNLAKAMENSIYKSIEILSCWPVGLAHVIASSEIVKSGFKPLQWFTTSSREDEQAEFLPLEDGDEIVAMVVGNDELEIDSTLDQKLPTSESESTDLFERVAALTKFAFNNETLDSKSETLSILLSLSLRNTFLLGMLDLARSEKSIPAKQFVKAMDEHRQARDAMVAANLKLVASIAKKFFYTGLPMADLIQDGNIGLLKAVDKFDWRKGFRFSTMATWWIRQSIHRAASELDRTIRLPSHVHAIVQKMIRANTHFEQVNDRPPTNNEVAEMMSLSLEKASVYLRISQHTESIDHETIDGLITPSSIDDFSSKDPYEDISDRDLSRVMDVMLSYLGQQHEQIIRLRFGFGVDESLTLGEVGSMLGVTRERIRQIEGKAIRILKQPQHVEKLQSMLFGTSQLTNVTRKSDAKNSNDYNFDMLIEDAPERQIAKPSIDPASIPSDVTKRAQSRRDSTIHEVMTQALEMGVDITVDRESTTGRTWIDLKGLPDDRHRKLIKQLLEIGYTYSPGKGYWR